MLKLHATSADCAHRQESGDCATCPARRYSVCVTLPDSDLERLDALAEHVALSPDQPLFHEGDLADHVYNVTSGSLRIYQLLPDGRRHVAGFLFAGDFIGLVAGQDYVCSAEAMEPATLCRFRKPDFETLMADRPELALTLLARAGHELAVSRARTLLLARKTAIERVATFLVDMAQRDPLRPNAPGQVRLPMTRGEIADYLGLTLETVSRCLSRLKRAGLIRRESRDDLRLVRTEALRNLADGGSI